MVESWESTVWWLNEFSESFLNFLETLKLFDLPETFQEIVWSFFWKIDGAWWILLWTFFWSFSWKFFGTFSEAFSKKNFPEIVWNFFFFKDFVETIFWYFLTIWSFFLSFLETQFRGVPKNFQNSNEAFSEQVLELLFQIFQPQLLLKKAKKIYTNYFPFHTLK